MKTFPLALVITAGVALAPNPANAQNTFRADLSSPQTPVTGTAGFVLNELMVDFTISFMLEDVVPTTARLVGPQSSVTFDLGEPHVAVHSPGPWPNGYDGSTAFYGTFQLPMGLRDDFVAGRTRLDLLGARVGDFSGVVEPAAPPIIQGLTRDGSTAQIRFRAEAPYQYTVEHSVSLDMSGSVGFTNIAVLSQPIMVIAEDSGTAPTRFYRVRRELYRQNSE